MSQVYVHRHVVGPSDIDYLGHASNIEYVRWVQDATVAHSESVGLSVAAYRKLGGIFVIRKNDIDYLRSANLGDELEIHTYVSGLLGAKAIRQTEILRAVDRAVLARAETTWGFVDLASGRPARVPHWVRDAFGFVAPPVPTALASRAIAAQPS
ncbi:MAG: thioesterase family protein [Polyangiaceae bacterium]